ncbi:hypothetical protein CBM2592_B100407 [Cupriavidus taiwanensis]|nr:hypothetical protein CBM2592_B100407 [Cupriavidus taiwanensis]SOZ93980.1 hypothetical protein CBM2621_B140087 [Cupriavidus taiwanensis]SPA19726.1 hypothetical protein CBM2631_B120405 [Cupriavidus taiwanensis]SPD57337.1 protein of unknown function [Cupriavidus taiwanensis]
MEAVGLVDRGHMLLALHRQFERTASDALRAVRGDLADRDRHVLRRHHLAPTFVHIAIGIETFGRLAHDDEIHVPGALAQELARTGGPHIGVQVQVATEGCGDIAPALFRRRIVCVRLGAKDHAVIRCGLVQHFLPQRRAMLFQAGKADIFIVELQAQIKGLIGLLQDIDGGSNDFGADAVARENKNTHGGSLS